MISKSLLISSLLAIFSLDNIAYAATWVKLVKSNERLIELDRDSIATQGYITTVWVKFTIENDLTKDGLTAGDYTQSLYYIHCGNNSFSEKQSSDYKQDGRFIRSFYNDIPKYEDIPDRSVIASIAHAVCKNSSFAASNTTLTAPPQNSTDDSSTWIEILQTNEHKVALNRSSIHDKSGITQVWTKSTVYKDLTKDKLTVGDYRKDLYYIDCQHQTASKVQGIAYKHNGSSIGSFRQDIPKFKSIIPNTIEASILDIVCNDK